MLVEDILLLIHTSRTLPGAISCAVVCAFRVSGGSTSPKLQGFYACGNTDTGRRVAKFVRAPTCIGVDGCSNVFP